MSPVVLVTGAAGFVGAAVCAELAAAGFAVRKAVRVVPAGTNDGSVAVGDIGAGTDWRAALHGIGSVVHLAARTHVLRESARDPLAAYRATNVAGTRALAAQAAAAGVRRVVFVSSIKVNGERTAGRPFTEADAALPEDAYGRSKWEAERALAEVAAATRIETIVLRPPLVYGPGVKANFLRLMALVARGVPLPFASIANRRSLLYVGTLAHAIATALAAPGAAGRTFLVSDGEDLSTPDLVRALARALGVPAQLLPFPPALLRLAAAALGRRAEIERLAGALEVDAGAIRRELGWRPPRSVAQGLSATARWFMGSGSAGC
ncbi:MAG: NAD-dependent epimerase/dehydratase family protein [Burkholderiales bacterium]|nr:NAD-dependent epimerase/dehydratase family protein [Burkholderiales bacterium]